MPDIPDEYGRCPYCGEYYDDEYGCEECEKPERPEIIHDGEEAKLKPTHRTIYRVG